jgi:membrane protease YdiL (CAAX protease family)
MPIGTSLLFMALPTLVLFGSIRYVLPVFIGTTGVVPKVAWFVVPGFAVFVPLVIAAILFAGHEIGSSNVRALLARLHLRPLNRTDWLWTVLAFLVVVLSCGVHWYSLWWSTGGQGTTERALLPSFLPMDASGQIPLWILLPWIPYFIISVLGEELFWRGYVLPRQENSFGWWAWVLNGSLWAMFHLPYGWNLWLVWIPMMYIIPFVVQRRQNVWIGILLHGIVNGGGILSLMLTSN